ncbi:MAG: hypothetical protein KGP28_12570 [Bdellovibrionales bacterium]|nr:hypothetical protein [Bdellovibrionales bacterium]
MKNVQFFSALLITVMLQGCAKIAVPIQQALSNFTRCEYRLEYRFPLAQVANPLADFSVMNAGGTVTPIMDSCAETNASAPSVLLSEHSIQRAASILNVSVGTENVMSLKVNSNQLSGNLADTCRNGNRAIHIIESGSISSSPKEMRLIISSRVVLSSCP